MKNIMFRSILLIAIAMLTTGCSTAPKSQAKRDQLHNETMTAIETFKKEDPTMQSFFDEAKGYAIFPSVGKGGIGLGGAYGKGELFKDHVMVGHCDLSQATIGFQLGGQVYSEAIFFQTDEALERFKTGNYAFSAQVSAVAVTAGVSADADYENGVAVFTIEKGGLMYEASVGGQKFSYVPK
ncbi:MAG: YSC84-related protein [Planctomycetota bacterium]|nr:YSC84-related protein [Planctomycetota bacterium]